MAEKKTKKEVKPADKKVGDILERHPMVENSARGLFRNENGTTIVQERVPRGDLPQDEVIMPRNEFDLTEDDLNSLADHAKKMIDPTLAKYDEDVAMEDALSKSVWSKDGGKYQGKVSASTQKLILETMKGGKKKTEKKAAEEPDKFKKLDALKREWLFSRVPEDKLEIALKIVKKYDPNGNHVRVVNEKTSKLYNAHAIGPGIVVKSDSDFDLKGLWAELRQGGLVKNASDLVAFQNLLDGSFVKEAAEDVCEESASIDSLVDTIPTSIADIERTKKTGKKPPKEAGMDKEMLRKEANDLAKKLDALKVLLDDGEESESVVEEVEKKNEKEDKDASKVADPSPTPGLTENPVLASLDEVAELVEKEAHEKQDMDLFRIAYQIDCVSDYLSGTKDASALQTDADDKFIRDAFKAGVKQRDHDEKFMDEFKTDNFEETSRVVGNVSVQHKQASAMPYAVKRDS